MSIFPGIVHLTKSDEYFKCLRKLRPFVKIETWLSHLSSFTSCQGISGGKAVHPLIEMANLWAACGELCVKHQHTAYRSVWIHSVWTRRKDLWVVSLNWVWVGEQEHRADGRPSASQRHRPRFKSDVSCCLWGAWMFFLWLSRFS